MNELWNKNIEKIFFQQASQFASPEKLFYRTDDEKFFAYWTKQYKGEKTTLQSRNSLIGNFTEKWIRDIIAQCTSEKGLYAIQGAICEKIALSRNSPADVVISKKNSTILLPEDILLIFEVKMSIVWNWEYINGDYICIGDYKTHQGTPGLLRSDSMLKAIGKSINIRVSDPLASNIPIIIIGNTPITESYIPKVDHLKRAGITQGFWSVNPMPTTGDSIKQTPNQGFFRFDDFISFKNSVNKILVEDLYYFSSMKNKKELGRLIEIASKENTFEAKAEKFLTFLRE